MKIIGIGTRVRAVREVKFNCGLVIKVGSAGTTTSEGHEILGIEVVWDHDPRNLPRFARPHEFRVVNGLDQILDLAR